MSQHQSWHNWDHANAEKCEGVRGIGTMFYGKCAFQYGSNAFTILPYATVHINESNGIIVSFEEYLHA